MVANRRSFYSVDTQPQRNNPNEDLRGTIDYLADVLDRLSEKEYHPVIYAVLRDLAHEINHISSALKNYDRLKEVETALHMLHIDTTQTRHELACLTDKVVQIEKILLRLTRDTSLNKF
ncbi:MAG: hypothetical protein AB1489_41075 [Acidobacteriota bacterium]